MASPAQQYAKELRGLGYLATWTPGTPISLGTIGVIEDDVFIPRSNLKFRGITFQRSRDATGGESIEHRSKGSVTITTKAKGKTSKALPHVPKAKAGLGIAFKGESAVVFSATGIRHHRISDQIGLEQDIWALFASGQWDPNWLVVTEIGEADRASILISRERDATVELSAAADIKTGAVSLADASLKLKIAYSSQMHTEILNAARLQAIFRAGYIRDDWWRGWVYSQAPRKDVWFDQAPDGSSGGGAPEAPPLLTSWPPANPRLKKPKFPTRLPDR